MDNQALECAHGRIESGVLGCDCCAFPVVAGIPVLIADDTTREGDASVGSRSAGTGVVHAARPRRRAGMSFQSLMQHPRPTYRDALAILSLDAEADCFLYRFSDPTFVMIEALLMGLGRAHAGPAPCPGFVRGLRSPDARAGRSRACRRRDRCGRVFLEALDGEAIHFAVIRCHLLRRQQSPSVRARRLLTGRTG